MRSGAVGSYSSALPTLKRLKELFKKFYPNVYRKGGRGRREKSYGVYRLYMNLETERCVMPPPINDNMDEPKVLFEGELPRELLANEIDTSLFEIRNKEKLACMVLNWLKSNEGLVRYAYRRFASFNEECEYEEFFHLAFIIAIEEIKKAKSFNKKFSTNLVHLIKHNFRNKREQAKSEWKKLSIDVNEAEEFIDLLGELGVVVDEDVDIEAVGNLYIVNKILSCLTVRQCEIVTAYLGLSDDFGSTPMTMLDISKKFGTSEASVSQTFKKARSVIRRTMQSWGYSMHSHKFDILEFRDTKMNKYNEVVCMHKITYVDVRTIKTNEKFNGLFSTKTSRYMYQIKDLEESIQNSGFLNSHPLEIWKEGDVLIDGYRRLSIAKRMDIKEVPVRYVSISSESEVMRYIISLHSARKSMSDYDLISAISFLKSGANSENDLSELVSKTCNISIAEAKQSIYVEKHITNEQIADLRNRHLTVKILYDDLQGISLRHVANREYRVNIPFKVPDIIKDTEMVTYIKCRIAKIEQLLGAKKEEKMTEGQNNA